MDNEMNIITIDQEFGQNFIDYAFAVNSDRSIPDVASGLKPVVRRILWSCYNKKMTSNKQHVKNARIVGNVIGTLHPHGDTSVYEALVKVSQPWRMRYPLIDFHGNMGNVGGDGPAAMRYTEGRLTKLAEDGMLAGLNKKNVEFMLNYDDTEYEPCTLPAVFPNILCNPNKGIGLAMASNWLPHNLREVASAIKDYIDGKEPTIPAPDFPLGGVITNADDIPAMIKKGRGSVKIRADYEIKKDGTIIFTSIPFGTNTETLLDQIQELSKEKPELNIKETRDECGKNSSIKIIVKPKAGGHPEQIVKQIFANTDFATSIAYNMVGIVDGEPKQLGLKEVIKVYVEHNIDCIIKETNYDIDKAEARLEIVNGLLVALADIDEVIAIIKGSKDTATAKEKLIKKYNFTEPQVKAILAMRLSSLTKLDGIKLNDEKDTLTNNLAIWKELVVSRTKQEEELIKRLDKIVDKYGDDRRTKLTNEKATTNDKKKAEIVPEEVVVVVSQTGLVKRIPRNSFRKQARGGKGVVNKDKAILSAIKTNTLDNLLLFSDKGKMYKLVVNDLPEGTNTTLGQPLTNYLTLDDDEKIITVASVDDDCKKKYILFITKNGLIKKSKMDDYMTSRNSKKGIIAIKLKDDDLIATVLLQDEEDVFIMSKNGQGLFVKTDSINPIGRNATGRKGMKLKDGDEVIFGGTAGKSLAVIYANGKGKRVDTSTYTTQGLNTMGNKYTNGNEVAGAVFVDDDTNLLLIGDNIINISASEIRTVRSCVAEGVILVKSSIKEVIKL